MSETVDIAGTSLTHRVVLVGLASLTEADETPAHAGEIRRVCTDRLDAVDGDVVGTLTEAEVARSLNELETETLVDATTDATSPTGKGRPRYELATDADDLLSALDDDERVSGLADRVGA